MRGLATAVLAGVAAGVVFLGAGGRVVMRAFALATTHTGTFSVRGTLTVVLAGAVAGGVGGLLRFATDRFLPAHPWLRRLVFAALCYVIATPGFRPPRPLVFALFAPAFLAYGLALDVLWGRLLRSGRPASA